MPNLVSKLNEILADEWACVRALRRSESQCDDPGKLEVIKRTRKDCSYNCVSLANAVRALGGRPTDIPSAPFALKLSDESLADSLDLAQSAQKHIIAEIDKLIDEPDLKATRDSMVSVRKSHEENVAWLAKAFEAD